MDLEAWRDALFLLLLLLKTALRMSFNFALETLVLKTYAELIVLTYWLSIIGSGMHLVRSHRLTYVQVPQVVTHLIFSDGGRDFAPPAPVLWSIHSRGV